MASDRSDGSAAPQDEDVVVTESRHVWQMIDPGVHVPADRFEDRLTRLARTQRRLRILRMVQHVGAVAGFIVSIGVAVGFSDMAMRGGAIGLAMAFCYRWLVLRRTPGAFGGAAPGVSVAPSLLAYREVLARRIADDSGAQLWSRLAIAVPAGAIFLYGFARSYPHLAPFIRLEAIAIAGGLTFTFASAVRRARRYTMELEALNDLDVDQSDAPS